MSAGQMRERVDRAVGAVLFNAANYPAEVQPHILGRDTSGLREKLTEAVIAALTGRDVESLPEAPEGSDEMGRFGFDGAEGIAFWIYEDASQEESQARIMFDDLPTLLAFMRHNLPGLFAITDDEAQLAEQERESHRYSLVKGTNPIQARCVCGWVGIYAREWRLHRERAALEAVEASR